ncbi:MAG: ribosome maturation factor RimM [Desulfobacterales bacterium]|jgi:16S rRNA processing protein RimM
MDATDELLIAEIVGVHGIGGNLKVRSYAESDELFVPEMTLAVKPPRGEKTLRRVKWVQPHQQGLLMALEGVDSREQAEALRGAGLFIQKRLLTEPQDGAFFWYELIGLRVFTAEDQYLGAVAAVFRTGSNDVYVVRNPDAERAEILLPAIASVIRDINLDTGVMRVNLLEGL